MTGNTKPHFSAPRRQYPQIYVFEDKHIPGWLKVGYTTKRKAEDRIREQFNTRLQLEENPYIFHHVESAIDDKGEPFTDNQVHTQLVNKGIQRKGEYFKTDIDTVKSSILEVKLNKTDLQRRTQTFNMRDEQAQAVQSTADYFRASFNKDANGKPRFLWNAKMRFGKTFASYQLARELKFTRVLIITYKPAVEKSWKDDLLSHVDFIDWQFISRNENNLESLDESKPYVYFASFQDLLGTTDEGETKKHNEWVHDNEWDMIVQDEYHYGAWRDTARELLDSDESSSEIENEELAGEDNSRLAINSKCFLYLSGTPFRAIGAGEFNENQIFNWTYADEQRAKRAYVGENNPYESLPKMMILTYTMPDKLKEIALRGEYNEFNLSYFFKAEGHYEKAEFAHKEEVQGWLDMIRGALDSNFEDNLKLGRNKPAFPFTDVNLRRTLSHMLWLLPDVASCYAMANLLKEETNKFYKDYRVVIAAGKHAGGGVKALEPLVETMDDPLKTKTITLSCGKLTTGVTVKPWTGIFMLRTLRSPETYFQSAFRVQSPWTIPGENGEQIIQKKQCYVFDFDPNRALQQTAEYASKLNTKDVSVVQKINEFIKYLPVLAYDGLAMEEIDAEGLLDISMGQTTSTMLAKGWNNALLVNVDNDTLQKLIKNEDAVKLINSIISYRRVTNKDINKTVISRTKTLIELQTKRDNKEKMSRDEKKELTRERREYNKERQVVREKLQTLATRIPLFMYLTDFREEKLTDVITDIEPELFSKVTGLTIDDFELLVELGLFNSDLMNSVVYKFREYEDASMSYSGINRHDGSVVGGFDVGK